MHISIVIPAYNEARYIGPCLDAIAQQTRMPDEVIVVDNNSTDETAAIVRTYPFARVVHETTQGIVPARNRGFAEAHGEIVARCDADTRVSPQWVETILHMFQTTRADAISGPATYYDLPCKRFFQILQINIFFSAWRHFKKHELLFGSNMACTKKIWMAVLPQLATQDSQTHEDMDLAICIHRVGGTIIYTPTMEVSISARRFTSRPGSLPSYIARYIKAFLV